LISCSCVGQCQILSVNFPPTLHKDENRNTCTLKGFDNYNQVFITFLYIIINNTVFLFVEIIQAIF